MCILSQDDEYKVWPNPQTHHMHDLLPFWCFYNILINVAQDRQ